MSTRLQYKPYVMAHVPVDKFEIVNGPGVRKCLEIQEQLRINDYCDATFTLQTVASKQSFKRTIKLAWVYSVQNGKFEFTGFFNSELIYGVYDTKTRTGWFNLD